MILYTILVTLFSLLSALMILLILVQKGKSSMGLGSLGGSTQLLFGGSGGQDLFQKITWGMGALFMGGSLFLSLMKRPTESKLLSNIAEQRAAEQIIPVPSAIPQPAQEPVQD